MSTTDRWKPMVRWLAPAIMTASILLVAPAAQARVGIGINLGFPPVIAPPIVVAPLEVAPPPVVVAPPPYYAPPPVLGFYGHDRWGHRHWRR